MLRIIFLSFLAAAPALAQGWPLPPSRTGNLYISGYSSNNVGEFSKDGSLVRTYTHSTMLNPRGVAVEDDGTLVVVVQTSSRLLRIAPDGTLLQTITHPDLTSGTGLSRSPAGHWYVGNFNPGSVLVFDSAWNHLTTLSVPGMNGVNCISFDSSGNGDFAVTAALVNVVVRFDAMHTALGIVTHPNIGSPMSIADDSLGNHYLSNGSSGHIIKFDASWNPLVSFGVGTLSLPQGIAIDEHDVLTISNFGSSTVHRYDTSGTLLTSFPLSGVTTGRNLAWSTSPFILARHGGVGLGVSSTPEAVLTVSGQVGDGLQRVQLGLSDPLSLAVSAPSQTSLAPFVLYAELGEPGPASVSTLPLDLGLLSFAAPFLGGTPIVVANSLGSESLLGTGIFPAAAAPTTVFSFPGGLGFPLSFTVQGLIYDDGAALAPTLPFSPTNTLTLIVN